MKNPNGPWERLKKGLKLRWAAEDFPGAEPRFQLSLFAKDLGIFVFLPTVAVVLFKSCEMAMSRTDRKPQQQRVVSSSSQLESSKSQIIDFQGSANGSTAAGVAKAAPGSLVKVRLLNVVETYSNAPVHAQIVDTGLGRSFVGSTIIGDAVSNSNYDRIDITFRYVRDQRKIGIAIPISARALSLDGTLGLDAKKKEGFFARAALNSSGSIVQDAKGGSDGSDLKSIVTKALTAGLMQEFGAVSQVERNRAQVNPPAEFFVELTDFFPGTGR